MSPTIKDRVLERLSFAGFYERELENLKPTTQGNYICLCPFHEDHSPSLSVNFKNGLYNCFSCGAQGDVFDFYMRRHGCDFKEALAALGREAGVDTDRRQDAGAARAQPGYLSLPLKELALQKRLPVDFLLAQGVKENRFPDQTVSTDFHYLNQASKLSAIRHRFANRGDKKFRWRKGDKVGLYGLWKLDKIEAAGWCLLVEGETDALTCWLHEIPALGIPGKKTWGKAKLFLGAAGMKMLQEVQVYLWEEPDAGVRDPKKPMEALLRDQVAADLPGVLVIPAPADYKDLSEAHCQGREIKPLLAELKKRARPPEPPPAVGEGFTLSDLGNARRLVAQHGQDLRYSYLAKRWYFWAGDRWRVDDCGEVERRAKQVIAEIYREAAESENFKQREALGQWALRSEESKRIVAIVRQAQSEPGVAVLPRDFDSNPWLFNCANGTIYLPTGDLRPHDRADLLTCLASVDYTPDAPCEVWEKFLWQIMGGDGRPEVAAEMMSFLQRALGYALTGDCREQTFFILWGSGSNGKSTLINLVTRLLGNYARNTPMETLLAKDREGEIRTDVARLDGPRLVTAKEVDRGRRLSESLVKELTGQDTVTARFLYAEHFDFIPQFKLFMSTNNKPVIRGSDNAIWRRINFIRFPVELAKADQDGELPEKLWAEAPGILAWLVRGCLSWQQWGLDAPAEVLQATSEYRAEMDVLMDFLEDVCIISPTLTATASALYEAYRTWAGEQGMTEKEMLKQRSFGLRLGERGFKKDKAAAGVRIWRGLGLRTIE